MALVVNDRVKETSTTTGTGTFSLAGASLGFETFVAGIGNTNTTYYTIVNEDGAFEVGIGTVTDATPDTLSRDTILSSSNGDAAVNFAAGTKDVFCTLPASKAVILDSSGNIVANNGSNLTALNASNISSGTLSSDRLPTVPTTKGGTGLTAIGTANQVLAVNAGATALEFQTPTTGDITAVTAGDGLTGGGSSGDVTLNVGAGNLIDVQADQIDVDLSELTTSTSDADGDFFVVVDSANAQKKLTKANINNSGFNNDAGFTTNTGTVTSVSGGNGLTGTVTTSGSLAVGAGTGIDVAADSVSIDLSELTTSTSDADGDFFAVVDSANAQKKLTKGNINISGFNNDSGFTTNTGTVTSVTGGNGLTGSVTTSGSLAVGAGTGIDVAADSISVDVSDFMSNGSNNRVVTATGTDGMNAEANLTFDGSTLNINGNIDDVTDIYLEDQIIHDGDTDTYLQFHAANQFRVVTGGTEMLEVNDSDVQITNGDLLPGTTDAQDLGSTSKVWRNLYTGDLHLSNEAKSEGNAVDGTKGNWTIQEGAEDLYLFNNKSGKRYKFKLEEV